MSEIGILSNQYEMLVSTSDKINNSVIAFKKKSILDDSYTRSKYPKLSLTHEEYSSAKETLVLFLKSIILILDEDFHESEFIPSIILEDYKRKLNSNAYFKEDIKEIVNSLIKDIGFKTEQLDILDNILSILDNERSSLFKKLRTARG